MLARYDHLTCYITMVTDAAQLTRSRGDCVERLGLKSALRSVTLSPVVFLTVFSMCDVDSQPRNTLHYIAKLLSCMLVISLSEALQVTHCLVLIYGQDCFTLLVLQLTECRLEN